ncbi:CRISPR/Cas system-associated exonuclease Cas4 (RecB family) [Microvirga lupini]|uniref:CRISPR/Cas system-associated exonuclease Cas4 (RecB family) n=1 Tax=Microvirga lupini TaxID=420324 RepID=A0A7W4YZ37_9HYPH|nr:hypothetical protein [Microvirga lupini]MBB3020648.1 CRISPR/Cas system-associated exonuclease Cas4 (RecB family) [Microvirga lupini]
MAVEVITPAENYRLTTMDAVRAEAGTAAEGLGDAAIEALIDQASGQVAVYCRRVFARETVEETIDDGSGTIILARTPVVEIETINGAAFTGSGCRIDKGAGIIRPASRVHIWSGRASPVVVVYTAGYALPEEDDRNLPVNVERATALVAATMLGNRQRDILVKSESVEGIGRTDYWMPGQGSFLNHPEAERLLAPFVMPTLA